MKKKNYRRWISAGILLVCLGIISQAQAGTVYKDKENVFKLNNTEYQGSLRIGTGYLTGTAHEIVNAGSFSENHMSRLNWEIDELYMGGFGFSFQKEWVVLHGDVWISAKDGEGSLDDYDWVMEDRNDWSDWSHHDDTTVEATMYDLTAEFLIPYFTSDHFAISLFLGFKHDTFNWDARGGTYIYSTTTFRDTTGTFPGGQLGISYEQIYKTPYIGVGLRGVFSRFEFSGRFIASSLVSSEGDDIHHLRNLNITSDMDDGNMYSVDLSGSFAFTKNWIAQLAFTHTSYDDLKGNATYNTVGDNEDLVSTTYLDAQSMALDLSMISFSVIYTF